jgi:O-antigen ligase
MVLPISLYILMSAQGRTEIVAFLAGAFVILALRRMSRLVMFSWGIVAAWLLVAGGYMQRLFLYWTRGGAFDPTLSGRTVTWQKGWEVFSTSPWIGLGFQADRYFLAGQHIHNGWLHALLQTGLMGTAAFVAAFALALAFMVRLYWLAPESKRLSLAAEVPGILVFFTIMNGAESTAFFSANWLLLAPAVAYLQLEFWKERILRVGVAWRHRGLGRPRPLMDFGRLG